MTALVCEFCGGSLITKAGGICECDSCGMQFDKTWVKEKIQEIQGTVKVEGTVEVTGKVQIDGGSVKVEGGINADNLLKRGYLALENGNWLEARKHFDEVLNFDVECVDAHLGKCFAHFGNADIHEIIKIHGAVVLSYDSFKNALHFMDASMAQQLRDEIDTAEKRFADIKRQEEEKALAEEYKRQREEAEQAETKRRQWEIARATAIELKGILSSSGFHSVWVNQDGTVCADGRNEDGQCNVTDWKGILSVIAGTGYKGGYTVGVKNDGTVVYAGDPRFSGPVRNWRNIKSVVTFHNNVHPVVIGLDGNGKVFATQEYVMGRRNGRDIEEVRTTTQTAVCGWQDIVSIACGHHHLIGLKSDGTVVATGRNDESQCNLEHWEDIIAIAGGGYHSVGLKVDGTVVAYGRYGCTDRPALDVGSWDNIVDIAANSFATFGLRADGTVIMTKDEYRKYGSVKYWENIVSIVCEGSDNLYGITADGTIVSAGFDPKFIDTKLFENAYVYAQERKCKFAEIKRIEAERKAEEERLEAERKEKDIAKRKAALEGEKTSLADKLANLKGPFSSNRRKTIEERLAQIEKELENL